MLRRDAANERLQEINPAALWDEASEMGCRLLEQSMPSNNVPGCLLSGVKQIWRDLGAAPFLRTATRGKDRAALLAGTRALDHR
jgi:hypothetical protein